MSKVQLKGNISGTGTVTIESPNTNSDSTITLPSGGGEMVVVAPGTAGNVITSNGTAWVSQALPASNNASALTTGIVGVNVGGTGANTLTAEAVIIGNTTSAVKFVSPGTSGNVLTSNGTAWTSTAPAATGGFASGTLMLFQQTAAPTGWTKQTTHNDKALRVVSGAAGSGGSVAFTTAFASGLSAGATTLSTTQIPGHQHFSFNTSSLGAVAH